MIYKHFGKRSISQLLAKEANPQFKQGAAALTTEEVDIIYLKVYDNFIEGIDGIDNGVTRYPGQEGNSILETVVIHT